MSKDEDKVKEAIEKAAAAQKKLEEDIAEAKRLSEEAKKALK